MMSKAEQQRQFVTMFSAGVVFDALAAVAVATKHEVWSHLSFLWSGPLDNIVFGIAGVHAAIFLLDPDGERTIGEGGGIDFKKSLSLAVGDAETQRGAASRFSDGAFLGLSTLSVMTVVALGASFLIDGAAAKGILEVSLRHLGSLLPIASVSALIFGFLRLSGGVRQLLKACALASLVFLVAAFKEGRADNYLYHLATNFESLHAWFLALGWAGLFAARKQPVGEHFSSLQKPEQNAIVS